MRLINVESLQLQEYFGEDIPPYAILSHTWGQEEVTFQHMLGLRSAVKKMKGFQKIAFCAQQAKKDQIQFCWVDTCCIDKTSSAELSEAINSMYQWYKNAETCYAYLADVTAKSNIGKLFEMEFANSRWFTRGWTLQELIAPPAVIFFGSSWDCLGNRSDFKTSIHNITNIQSSVLATGDPSKASIAQRMSWASRRKTTRVEDAAYSLLGMFNVHMPPLYGEGNHAFIRLQEEIIKAVDDETIFAWTDPSATSCTYLGLLARSPINFELCGDLLPNYSPGSSEPFAMTNRGLRISLHCIMLNSERHEYWAQLQCARRSLPGSTHMSQVYIKVRRLSETSNEFVRVDSYQVFEYSILPQEPKRESTELLYVRQTVLIPERHRTNRVRGFLLESWSGRSIPITTVWTNQSWVLGSNLIEFNQGTEPLDTTNTISAKVLFKTGRLESRPKALELEYNPLSDTTLKSRKGEILKPHDFCGCVYKFNLKEPREEDFDSGQSLDDWEILKSMTVILVEDILYIQVLLDTKGLHSDLIEV